MDKKFWCIICLQGARWVEMEVMDGYLKCPSCGSETWPDMNGDYIDRVKRQIKADTSPGANYVSLSLPEGLKVHGGSDPSGSTPQINKKKTTQKLYQQLFKET